MSEWICDFCLVNKLDMPYEMLKEIIPEFIKETSLKQFYFQGGVGEAYPMLLIEQASSYKWRKSKILNKDNEHLFEKHIYGAISYAVEVVSVFDSRFDKNTALSIKKSVRDAFSGSLCAYSMKRRIDIEYVGLERNEKTDLIITSAVKYCENKIRAYLGLKSRLACYELDDSLKKRIDDYFEKELPIAKEKRGRDFDFEEEKPFSLSLEDAKQIEKTSWSATDKLVIFEEEPEEEKEEIKSEESETLDVAFSALRYIYEKEIDKFNQLAEQCFMLPETLLECVNELCYERLGDIAVELENGVPVIIDDYGQEIKEWLKV